METNSQDETPMSYLAKEIGTIMVQKLLEIIPELLTSTGDVTTGTSSQKRQTSKSLLDVHVY